MQTDRHSKTSWPQEDNTGARPRPSVAITAAVNTGTSNGNGKGAAQSVVGAVGLATHYSVGAAAPSPPPRREELIEPPPPPELLLDREAALLIAETAGHVARNGEAFADELHRRHTSQFSFVLAPGDADGAEDWSQQEQQRVLLAHAYYDNRLRFERALLSAARQLGGGGRRDKRRRRRHQRRRYPAAASTGGRQRAQATAATRA